MPTRRVPREAHPPGAPKLEPRLPPGSGRYIYRRQRPLSSHGIYTCEVCMIRRLSEKVVPFSAIRIRISGAPRTKKNHGSVITRTVKGKRRKFHIPSDAWTEWAITSHIVGNAGEGCDEYEWPPMKGELPDQPYNVTALFYRDASTGDAVGYYQGLADLLQKRKVIRDDKWLVSWDGSRLLKDASNPRVELTLTPLPEAA